MRSQKIRIDIVSDVMCPWCIVGYKKLQQAIARLGTEQQVEIHWQPFELNPDMPAAGQGLTEHIMEKYAVTAEQSKENRERLVLIGAELGFNFNFSAHSLIVNSFLAHQLVYWSALFNKQTDTKMALFTSFFSEQKNVSELSVLLAVAKKVGLDVTEAEKVLREQRYASDVRREQKLWLSRGVQAVPAFIFSQKYVVNGAQDPAAFLQVFETLASECND